MTSIDRPLIVVADDDPQFLQVMSFHLRKWDYEVALAASKGELLQRLEEGRPAALLIDVRFGEHDGVEVLREVLDRRPQLKAVMLTAFGSIETAITAIRFGAVDFLTKPVDLNRLRATVNRAVETAERIEAEPPSLPCLTASAGAPLSRPIIGESPATRELRRMIDEVAPSDATVLILGESGTGKELVARAIHERSRRHEAPFVPINVAALPRELVESTLFGHEKGAFTGADQLQRGCCEVADRGTLFLDEIGEMEVGLQSKLLRFLQERSFQRVGQSRLIEVDVRIVAATNRDPHDLIRRGQLRADLFYRLNVVPIHLRPLRERREDIRPLVDQFLRRAAARHRKEIEGFTPEAMQAMIRFDWPGNVRQLENMVERLTILGRGPRLEAAVVESQLRQEEGASPARPTQPVAVPAGGLEAEAELRPIDRMEKQAILDSLQRAGGNVRDAAGMLGLSQATIYRKIKRYGIATR